MEAYIGILIGGFVTWLILNTGVNMNAPTRCCICRGTRQYGELEDRIFVEPTDGDDPTPQYTRGWMCEECKTIHWAEDVE
jgi:hypothetical protein